MAAPANSNSTFAPHQSSPLARNTSPFTDPRTPPCTPRNTAKLWDEYERLAVERARSREHPRQNGSSQTSPEPQRLSNGTVLDIIRSYDPYPSPRAPSSSSVFPSPSSNFAFPDSTNRKHTSKMQPVVSKTATCKICQQPITSRSGRCKNCGRTMKVPSPSATPGETTRPLSPASRNFASIDLSRLHHGEKNEHPSTTSAVSWSSKSKSSREPTTISAQDFYQCTNPPIRLSSLRPPPLFSSSPSSSSTEPPSRTRSRNPSLTDPNEPALRVQLNCTTNRTTGPPSTPPYTSSSSSSTSSRPSTRPSSLANLSTPPHMLIPTAAPQYVPTGATIMTPSYHSTALSPVPYPYPANATYSPAPTLRGSTSTAPSSPPSVCRASYQLQNTMSVWEDWDDGEQGEEKVGLVGYWRGKVWRGSRGSLGGQADMARGERDGVVDGKEGARDAEGRRSKRWARVLACGCKD